MSHRMGTDVGQLYACKRRLENGPDRGGVCPRLLIEPAYREASLRVGRDPGLWEQRIVRPEQLFLAQKLDPLGEDCGDILPYRVEAAVDWLAKFRVDLARVLQHASALDRSVFEFKAH